MGVNWTFCWFGLLSVSSLQQKRLDSSKRITITDVSLFEAQNIAGNIISDVETGSTIKKVSEKTKI